MFLQYAISSGASNSATTLNLMLTDVQSVFAGTLTSISNFNAVCDQSNSFLVGGGSNITNEYTVTKNTNTNSGSDNTFSIQKKHSEYSVSYPLGATLNFYTTYTGTYGVRSWMTGSTSNNGGSFPSALSSSYAFGNTNYKVDHGVVAGSTYWFWANPYNCGVAFATANLSEYHASILCDHDVTEYNKYVYDNFDTQHSAMVNAQCVLQSSTYGTSSYTQFNAFAVGTTDFISPSSASQSVSSFSSTAYHDNYSSATNTSHMSLTPLPYKNVYPLQYSAGHQHQLIPVFIDPGYCSDTANYPVNGRMKYFYRTSDNFGPNGTRITVNGQEYASIQLHKSGGQTYSGTNTTENSIYLIPTSVGGY